VLIIVVMVIVVIVIPLVPLMSFQTIFLSPLMSIIFSPFAALMLA